MAITYLRPNLSRANLRALITCDLIQGAIESVVQGYKDHGITQPEEVVRLILGIQKSSDEARNRAVRLTDNDGKWLLGKKETMRYSSTITTTLTLVRAQFGERLDAKEYLKLVQCWAEDMKAEQPPMPPERRIVWNELTVGIQNLYLVFDPEWSADDAIDRGMAKAEELKRATGLW